jgi:hypothetical protein
MVLNPDFREFIESLNSNGVRYLVIGGYAVAFHAHPRYTKVLDIWLEGSLENANRMVMALQSFGFGSLGLGPSDFTEPDQIIQLLEFCDKTGKKSPLHINKRTEAAQQTSQVSAFAPRPARR